MEVFNFKPKGVCSSNFRFEIEGDRIRSVVITGGCPGNLLGISRMLKDKTFDEVIEAFDGVRCGAKPTSCPDQIATALKSYRQEHQQ